MEYSKIHGYEISKLTLGTVAFGLDYGISNTGAKPAGSDSFTVMSEALNAGINSLDTARGYGNAEELIGDFLATRKEYKKTTITTKFRISKEHLISKDRLYKEVFDSVRASLRYLKLPKLPFCLFHMPEGLPVEDILKTLPGLLNDLKHEALIDVSGVSVYHPDQVEWLIPFREIQALQVPMNLFDNRLIQKGLLKRMALENKAVFIRSVFLQGLFFMDPDQLKGNLTNAAPYLVRLRELAATAGMSVAQLAFSYIKDREEVTSIVFGAVTPEQVRQNIHFLRYGRLDENIKSAIEKEFGTVPENILMPGSWKY